MFSKEDVTEFEGSSGHVVLSEILASNKTYPNKEGYYLDFIEIRNLSSDPADISGYMLSDALDSIGYAFPQGTVLPGHGYLAIWCNKEAENSDYALFGISKDGGETIYLYNSVNVIVDTIAVPRMNDNMPFVRSDDGIWQAGTHATPGFENTENGFKAWLSDMNADNRFHVTISEVMSANSCTVLDQEGHLTDWVEIYNHGTTPAVLDGAYLSDDPADAFKWQIPQLTIAPGERAVIRCVSESAESGEASFALPRSGCTVVLTGIMGNTLSSVTVPALPSDHSWALTQDGSYAETDRSTPGYENSDAGYASWLAAVDSGELQVVISEVMTSNMSTLTDSAGRLCDWIELTNVGSSTAVLDGAYLSDDPDDRGQWRIPCLTIEPGQSVAIACVGSTAAEGEANFALKKSGCTLTLTGSAGNILHTLEVPALDSDRSWARQSDGSYIQTDAPSPGYSNDDAGRKSFLLSQTPAGALAITEVMPSNAKFLKQSDGKFYDWVELQNISAAPVALSDYCLSNDPDYPEMMHLPKRTLEPGERIVIICSGNTALAGGYIQAPFTLSRKECWVYVTKNGSFSDYMRIYDVPYQGSVGKEAGENGTYYFTEPTPGTENGTGVAFLSATPQFLTADGVFNGVSGVTVELSGSGSIRYTTDGSLPTASSPLYTGPITLHETTVIRAAGFEDGKLRSDVVTGAYIVNENHTLPVISVTVDPGEMFGGAGIHTNYHTEREIPCNLKLFDGESGFSIDCGIKMFGHMGLSNPKKSFKVNFRGRYGEDMLNYPVYGDDAPQYFDSLIIRSGQDYPLSIFRDELFTSLARDTGNNILAQEDKFSILYINGQYWGIYCMKEAFCETMIANHYDVSEESVEIVQAPVGSDSEIFRLINYCRNADMNDQETWDYLCSKIDMASIIDWMIMEAYSTNTDTQQNLRYFRSTELGNKWMFAYYDIDWGWHFDAQFSHVLSPNFSWQHMGLTKNLVENREFRKMLLERLSELMASTLSDENVMARIEHYAELLDPEVPRERERWGSSYAAWQGRVQELRDFLNNGHLRKMVTQLRTFIGLTNEEAETYFGRWIK